MARRRKPRRKKTHQIKLPALIWLIILAMALSIGVVGCQLIAQRSADVDTVAQHSDDTAKKQAFIDKLAPYAQELQQVYGVMPSITLAQAILESDWGDSTLAAKYHNLFGIKATTGGVVLTTQEYLNGKWHTVNGRFAVYASDQASMKAHALLFVNGTAWNAKQYADVLAAKTYQQAATALHTDGYATDPDYPTKLVKLIQEWQLDQYDQ